MLFELPCGFTDSSNQFVREVELEEMTGYEEDFIADRNKWKSETFMTELLSRCTKRLGTTESPAFKESERWKRLKVFEEPYKMMLIPDRSFLFVKLREASFGPEYRFQVTCPVCKEVNKRVVVKLDELQVKEMLEDVDPNSPDEKPAHRIPKAENRTTLPSGKLVSWRHLTGADEALLEKAKKTKEAEFLSSILFQRITDFNGQGKPKSLADIKDLSSKDRAFLRGEFDRIEGGLDLEIEGECPSCNHKWMLQLPVGQKDFFVPIGDPLRMNYFIQFFATHWQWTETDTLIMTVSRREALFKALSEQLAREREKLESKR